MDKINDVKFQVGSIPFFKNIEGFKPHDEDVLILQKENDKYTTQLYIKFESECVMYWKYSNKESFIQTHLDLNKGIILGKFLVPEVIQYINLTIDDLKQLKPLLKDLDDKHLYQKYIYNYYIQNNDFKLTEKQLNQVYKIYLQYREN